MESPRPFFREAGAGPGVVCLHANASSSGQWRGLMERLATRFHVLAPDAYGAGRSPAWSDRRPISLGDEVALCEPVFARAGAPLVLVGHSYGAAVALVAALRRPDRIRALALYEPTLFALIDAESRPPNDADGIRATVRAAAAALEAGDAADAARHFIDYWTGLGAWDSMPAHRQDPIAASIPGIRGWAGALFGEPTPLRTFNELDLPVLYLLGRRSPPSTRSVARLLTQALPRVTVIEFAELGHMGPVTHPALVDEEICRFIERH